MSKKELHRKTLLEGYKNEKLTLVDCAKKLEISYRQAKRIWKKYKEEGDSGLCHQNRGRKPSNAYSHESKVKILELYQKKYLEFGPTLASEKLLEDDQVLVNAETLRLWLKEAGLWTRRRKIKVYRERRERRPCFGDLLQIDGSIHHWFSDERNDCLLNMVDDATGITLALMDKGETTYILLTCLKKWIESYGIPKSVYVDLKTVYVSPKHLKEKYDDDLLIKEGFSVFEQACKALDITIIKAYSAQAKGRVERKHGVFQDRFVKDLKLYGINSIEAANEYLEKKFLPKINEKFAYLPRESEDKHREATSYGDLDQILCWNYKRQLKNNWSIQFKRDYFQVKKPIENKLQPGDFITIKTYLDGSMRFWYQDKEVNYQRLSRKPEPLSSVKKPAKEREYDTYQISQRSKKSKNRTPWGQFNPNWLSKKSTQIQLNEIAVSEN